MKNPGILLPAAHHGQQGQAKRIVNRDAGMQQQQHLHVISSLWASALLK